jgi:hypothetical protein
LVTDVLNCGFGIAGVLLRFDTVSARPDHTQGPDLQIGCSPSSSYKRRTLTDTQALNNLGQFTGTEQYDRHLNLLCTDGVMFLAANADCFWLLDAIASYQPQLNGNKRLAEFQLWDLAVTVTGSGGFSPAVLTCRDGDSDDPVITQKIEATDFPLVSIRLYVEGGVLLLPTEH